MFWLSLVAGFLMMSHVTLDVFARTVLRSPLPGTGEITASYYMIAAAFLPWAYVTLNNQHITTEFFTKLLPPAALRILDFGVELLTTVYVGLFVWQSFLSANKRTIAGEIWEIPGGYLEVWPVRWLLPLAGIAMIAVLVLRILMRLMGEDPNALKEQSVEEF